MPARYSWQSTVEGGVAEAMDAGLLDPFELGSGWHGCGLAKVPPS
jgi:hypothetical protein